MSRFSLNLGWKDSNLRNAWTKTRCLTTWRHPTVNYYLIKIMLLCQVFYFNTLTIRNVLIIFYSEIVLKGIKRH